MTDTETAKQLALWADKAKKATARRDELIRKLHGEGQSLRNVAFWADLSHSAIAKICARTTPEKETTNVR